MPTRFSYLSNNRPLWAGALPRLYRFAVLAAAAMLVHVASLRPREPDTVSLSDARTFFPDAAVLAGGDRRLGGQIVVDAEGRTLGLVLTTSPHTDDIIGYAGPSNVLIALDPQQRVLGVRLLASGDTLVHVDQVQKSDAFWRQFRSWQRGDERPGVEAVSGSTLTSLAMAEAIERRLSGSVTSLRFPDPVTLAEVQSLFPAAASFQPDDPRPGWHRALNKSAKTLGFAVRTSPYTDNARGYRGPTESLIAVSPDQQTVTGVILRRSYDTPDYVDRVKGDEDFFKLLTGRTIHDWAKIDFAQAGIEGVSGATQTSFAVADGLQRRFAADQAAAAQADKSQAWNPSLLAVIAGALAMTFSPLRTSRRLRTLWQVVLIAVFLFWLGDLLSLALLAGWSRHGVPWQASPSVVLLVAVALIIPWATRRQIYCHQICPHGAAQTWLGRFKRLHLRIPPRVHHRLTRLRPALLAAGLAVALFWLSFDLAWLEPFDGWVLKSAATVSATIAVAGLVASLFVPQAYCRYACPTGELLALLKSGGSHDTLTRRDLAAGGLVLLAAAAIAAPAILNQPAPIADQSRATTAFSGQAFGTTWSVKLRGSHDAAALETAVAAELERIESTLSHWRPDSFTAQFNANETTLPAEYPADLINLVAKAQEISRLSGGAYDITIAPLVDAWGYGPSGPKTNAPSNEQIAELLARTGWQRLIVDQAESTLQKTHPQLQIDLGSLLQGYAADRVARMLDEANVGDFLVEIGGELFARGAWQVAIEDPRDPSRPFKTITLTDSGLATSGLYRAKTQFAAAPSHHLISPQTGRPTPTSLTLVSVIAPTALEADAWATALLALGSPASVRLAEQQGLTAFVIEQ